MWQTQWLMPVRTFEEIEPNHSLNWVESWNDAIWSNYSPGGNCQRRSPSWVQAAYQLAVRSLGSDCTRRTLDMNNTWRWVRPRSLTGSPSSVFRHLRTRSSRNLSPNSPLFTWKYDWKVWVGVTETEWYRVGRVSVTETDIKLWQCSHTYPTYIWDTGFGWVWLRQLHTGHSTIFLIPPMLSDQVDAKLMNLLMHSSMKLITSNKYTVYT